MLWQLMQKNAILDTFREKRLVGNRCLFYLLTILGILAAEEIVPSKMKALAQSRSIGSEEIRFVEPNVQPPKTGPNTQRMSRQVRCCPCGCPEKPVTALVPAATLGQTTAAYPTFFVYVPPTFAQNAEFVLFDEDDNLLYETTVNIAGRSGIIKLDLPVENIPPLELSKNYIWEFGLVCDPDDRSDVTLERAGGFAGLRGLFRRLLFNYILIPIKHTSDSEMHAR